MGGQQPGGSTRRGSRTVRSAVQAAIDAATLTPADHALAAVALQLAGQLDKASRIPRPTPVRAAGLEGTTRDETPAERARRRADVVALSRELRAVLSDLPLRPGRDGGGDDDDHDAPASTGPISVDAELAGIVGAGATLGDAPLS